MTFSLDNPYGLGRITPRRGDATLGVQVGKVTRVAGSSLWYSVDAGFERGPARMPLELVNAATIDVATSNGTQTVTKTPTPVVVGDTVVVQATRSGHYVLARYR